MSLFDLVEAARLADLILSLPPAALRPCDSPPMDNKVTGRIGQHVNSP